MLNINFPFIISGTDYHEGQNFYDKLKKISNNSKIKYIEVDISLNGDFPYYFLFYVGKKPTVKEIRQLIKKENF